MTSPCVRIFVHVVWSTKHRRPVLDRVADAELERICAEKAREGGGSVVAFGSAHDPVHLILRLASGTALGDLVGPMKGASSRLLDQLPPIRGRLKWQSGYWGDSIHPDILPAASRYVTNQRTRHLGAHPPERWELATNQVP